ncbi:RNA polymerase factor sigma-54 [Roseovarius mucosus]|jgi:RNA polymerase sigma-54 factor|uniref:RNA polymerase factor sigma-54 n=1 Tax=Roseovarius mucosus TaxID=215743 RepID=UPI001C5FB308|nr:RNA polymerase factor sigma-54 [Roseovarius mucosus]MBW4973967.1 RNA polymerase factor sigma-54 [Roseovarius mucosus]
MNLQISQRAAQTQGLVMTGHMQQAIALLQLSNTDLQRYIEQEAEENPFIEVARSERALPSLPHVGGKGADADDATGRIADHPLSLYAHVAAQFDLMFNSTQDRLIADRFLEALDENGWLGEPLEEIAFACALDMTEAEHMLHAVQAVEPAGLFARTLAECLALQAEDQGLMTPLFRAVLNNLPRLAAADLTGLARVCACTMDDLRATLKQLRSLNPKPGADFHVANLIEREPDLIVSRGASGWKVELNRSTLPAVLVDEESAAVATQDKRAREYVGERLGVARWLRRAVEHRNQTALAVGAEIVRRQAAFLEHGPAKIAPMTLADVAQAIGVHESTVSRVTTGILMVTPQGTMGLKRFFSTALAGDADGEGGASAAAVRYRIQKMVAGEDPTNPLSDDAIAQMISADGPVLARRTVAKYRDMLHIPSSFQRKRQGKLNGM